MAEVWLRAQREAAARLRALFGARRQQPRPPRVCLISQHPYPAHPLLTRNVNELLANGVQVDLVCTWDPASDFEPGHHPGLRLHRIRLAHRRSSRLRYPLEYLAFFVQALPRVFALALRRRPDTVQVDNLPDFLVFSAYPAAWRGARVVLCLYELMPELTAVRLNLAMSHPLIRLTLFLERKAIGRAHHVIAVNEACRRSLLERGVNSRKLSVIPNTMPFPPTLHAATQSQPIVVTHATLVARYGVHVGLAAFALLRQERPSLRMLVLGDGEQLPELQALATRLGIADAVEFCGYLPWFEAMSRIRECAVGIVPVLDDGYGRYMVPMKLYEYVSLGIPAVCSKLPAIQDYFPPESLAYFEPGDAAGLAEGVRRLLADPAAAQRQAAAATKAMRPLMWEEVRWDYLAVLGVTPEKEAPGRLSSQD